MKKNTIFVGLDVHKNSIDIALADSGRDGDVRFYGSIGGDLDSLHKVVRKLQSTGSTLRFVYEAGPCGYDIYRSLKKQGLDCSVVAPSKIPRKSGDRIKNDRRDALNLARLHRSGELTPVYVPTVEDEAMRDLTRGRDDAVKALRTARQVLLAFLLRHGHRYSGLSHWSKTHWTWIAGIKMPHRAQQITLQEYVHAVHEQLVFIPKKICRRLQDYVRGKNILPNQRIFPITYAGARKMVVKVGEMVGVNLRPYDLRRHAATYASRSGIPIEIVSKVILQHADLSTTQRYLGKVSDLEAIRWIENLHG